MQEQQPPAEDFVRCYFWISHGVNVSAVHNVYPYETQFKHIAFYSKLFKQITTVELKGLFDNPCTILSILFYIFC